MSLNTASLQTLFTSTTGADPVFDAIDGANCPTVATGSSCRPQPAAQQRPHPHPHHAACDGAVHHHRSQRSLRLRRHTQYDRPADRQRLPASAARTASLPFLSTVMWDTRETLAALNSSPHAQMPALTTDLTAQMERRRHHARAGHLPYATTIADRRACCPSSRVSSPRRPPTPPPDRSPSTAPPVALHEPRRADLLPRHQ